MFYEYLLANLSEKELMRAICLISFLIATNWLPNLFAQTSASDVSKAQQNCRIALPYRVEQHSDCSPQSAAAYDFAFCSVYYIMTSLSAPESDKLMGGNGKSEAFKKKGMTYANISAALSDTNTLRKNVALAKTFFESLKGQNDANIGASVRYVGQKCSNVEGWHAQVLVELSQKMKLPPVESQ